MGQHDIFERILTSMHEAALRDGGWTAISALVDEACGTKGSNISFCEVYADAEAEVFFARACYRGQRNTELERLYFDNYYEHDERRPGMRRSPHGQLVHVDDLFSERQKKTSALYNGGLPVADFQNSLNVRLDGPKGSRIFRALADPVDSHGWTPDRVASIKRILPHLGQYVAVRQALVDARALDTSLTKLLDNTLSGIVQLDCRRRILAANDRALEMLRRGDGLSDEDGCLRARAPAADDELQQVLAHALPAYGGQAVAGSVSVSRPRPLPPLVVRVNPVGAPHGDWRPRGAAALVLVFDRGSRIGAPPQREVAAALGLTPTEGRTPTQLAEGRSVREISDGMDRSHKTVRWHMLHIFAKLGVSRQAELVGRVLPLTRSPRDRR